MSLLFDCCEPKRRTSRSPAMEKTQGTAAAPPGSEPLLGAREDDVDALVEQILKDPSIRIAMIPDSVERSIYKSTVQLTLSAFYSILSGLEGTNFLTHQIHLQIVRSNQDDDEDSRPNTGSRHFLWMEPNPTSEIDNLVLEEVATRLLANKAAHQRFLPDRVEHMLYTNCLKVVFRVIDILTASLHVTVCGHAIGLFVEPDAWQDLVQTASSSWTEMDQEKLREFARVEAGITEELGFWDSLFVPREYVARMHASLYGLILGIADDMLATTKIEILSDHIKLDIVPANTTTSTTSQSNQGGNKQGNIPCSKSVESHTTTESRTEQTSLGSTAPLPTVDPTIATQDPNALDFDTERRILLQRFQEMTPEQLAILAEDLNGLLGEPGAQMQG